MERVSLLVVTEDNFDELVLARLDRLCKIRKQRFGSILAKEFKDWNIAGVSNAFEEFISICPVEILANTVPYVMRQAYSS